jgi:hypothetical protein
VVSSLEGQYEAHRTLPGTTIVVQSPGMPSEPLPTVPVACTLDRAGLADRRSEWEALAPRAREEIPAGLRLTYGAEAEAELRRLGALERECCAWAEWSVYRRERDVVLEVTAPAEVMPAVREVFST